MQEILLYLLTGAVAGVCAGLFGVGGGVVVVPMLSILFQQQHFPGALIMHMAVGTSLAVMIFTSMSAAYAYYRRGLIVWPLFYRFSPGLVIGTIAGTFIGRQLSSNDLSIAFAAFLLIMALHLFFRKEQTAERQIPPIALLIILSFFIGILSGFFGVGGGTIMVPFFVYCSIEMHKATGTSALCGFPLAIAGTISMILAGWDSVLLELVPDGATGFVFWPAAVLIAFASLLCAPLGTRLAVWMRAVVLQRVFAFIMILTAINLVVF